MLIFTEHKRKSVADESGMESLPTVDISNEKINWQNGAELIDYIAKLDRTTTAINFSNNSAYNFSAVDLAQAFAHLPPTLITINLQSNWLGNRPGELLGLILAALPRSLKRINLADNKLGNHMSSLELAHAFACLPPALDTIFLGGNNLGYKRGEELEYAFGFLPKSLRRIRLNSDGYGVKRDDELAKIFTGLPNSIIEINLSTNWFGLESSEDRLNRFVALHQAIKVIDLRKNDFDKKTDAELEQIFSPLVVSNTSKQILIEPRIQTRLNSIFTSISISNTTSVILGPLYLEPSPQSVEVLLSIEMLSRNDNANLNMLSAVLCGEIDACFKAKQQLPEPKRLRPSKDLLVRTVNSEENHIPELKFLHDLITRILTAGLAIPDVCSQLTDNEKAMPVAFLMHELPLESLNKLVLQLRSHQPVKSLALIEDLTWHLYTKFASIAPENPEFSALLASHFEWLREKSTVYLDKYDIARYVQDIKNNKSVVRPKLV